MSELEEASIKLGNEDVPLNRLSLKTVPNTKDSSWIQRGFMVSGKDFENTSLIVKKQLYRSTADRKMSDSSLGGSRALNPKPQSTRYADIRNKGRRTDRTNVTVNYRGGNIGMGRYYSEVIDDNAQHLMLTPGIPHFQSLFTFASRAVDINMSSVANTGKPSSLYKFGQGMGIAALFMAFPITGIIIYSLKLANSIASSSMDDSYYTIKPALDIYWNTVNTLVNYMSTNLGLVNLDVKSVDNTRMGIPLKIDKDTMDKMKEIAPNIFTNDNYVDVFAMANRLPLLITKSLKKERAFLEEVKEGTFEGDLDAYLKQSAPDISTPSFDEFLKDNNKTKETRDIKEKGSGDIQPPETDAENKPKSGREDDGSYLRTVVESVGGFLSNLTDSFNAASSHGAHFVTFEVDHVGSVTDTFSNTFKDIPTKGTFNSSSGAMRDIKFSMAGGNILGDVQQKITTGIADIGYGTLNGMTAGFDGIAHALMNGGYINMPQMWDESSTNVATHTFKTTLISPYGHPLSSLQAIYIPLAALLALILPLQTGRHSHTSPLLTRAYLKGLVDIKLGMLKDLTITRGVSNLPYTRNHRPLALDISFSIVDLSNHIAAPVSSGKFGSVDLALDDANPLNRYLNAITGQSIDKVTYALPKAMLNYSRTKHSLSSFISPDNIAMRNSQGFLGHVSLFLQQDNSIDAVTGG